MPSLCLQNANLLQEISYLKNISIIEAMKEVSSYKHKCRGEGECVEYYFQEIQDSDYKSFQKWVNSTVSSFDSLKKDLDELQQIKKYVYSQNESIHLANQPWHWRFNQYILSINNYRMIHKDNELKHFVYLESKYDENRIIECTKILIIRIWQLQLRLHHLQDIHKSCSTEVKFKNIISRYVN